MFGRTEQSGRMFGVGHHEYGGDEGDYRDERQRLSYVQPGYFLFSSGKMDRGDHRTSGTDHEADSRKEHKQGNADVDGGDSVAAYAVADEDTVYGGYGRHAEHPQQCRDEIFSEQGGDVQCT